MKTYARIEMGAVAELLRTEAAPADLFHAALRWVEVGDPAVAVGWIESATGLAAPSAPAPVPAPESEQLPTVAALQAQLAELAAKVAALTPG